MSVPVDVYQCPECELKFRFSSELDQHLALEHPDFKSEEKTAADQLLHASHKHRHKKRDLRPD